MCNSTPPCRSASPIRRNKRGWADCNVCCLQIYDPGRKKIAGLVSNCVGKVSLSGLERIEERALIVVVSSDARKVGRLPKGDKQYNNKSLLDSIMIMNYFVD